MKHALLGLGLVIGVMGGLRGAEGGRVLRFEGATREAALAWQETARAKLFALMMGGQKPARGPLHPVVVRREEVKDGGYVLEELTLQTLPDRRVHAWLARPGSPKGKVGGVLAIHGHGGSGEQIVRGTSLYWYGRRLAELGYVVIAPDVGQHELQHTNWTLMGERTWDALRCVDYVAGLPEVDAGRLAVVGLSLGGETTMYVGALDERLKVVGSSGWLTTVANMRQGHCGCYDFPGLAEHFDFADVFACVAPRRLVCELGDQERAPGGFPVAVGRQAAAEIRRAYQVLGAEQAFTLEVHPGPHVFSGRDFFPAVEEVLGKGARRLGEEARAAAWVRFVEGPESLDGTPYYWLGRTAFRVTMEVAPQPGDALELGWGAKSDWREAVVTINGKEVSVRDGGHWGFRWVRVPVPAGMSGDRYDLGFRAGQGVPAFLSEVRLVVADGGGEAPDLRRPATKARMELIEAGAAAPPVFPEMRAVWDRAPEAAKLRQAGGEAAGQEWLAEAERRSRQASEAFYRSRRFVDGWLAQADPATGLIPRNLREGRDFWNGRDAAADNYPYMVLTAAMTDRGLFEGRMREMLRTEERLTSRVGRLPDDYSFSRRGWRRETVDLDAVVFEGAEYVKDGLLPITEWLGTSPWSERMVGIVEDLWTEAKVETPFGPIPTLNIEVNGDLMQANARLFWLTGERRYLEWAARLADYYLLGTNHPTRDLRRLRLLDHGCEVVNGLTEVYVAMAHAWPEKRAAYRAPMHAMFDTILEKGRNEDGLLYAWFDPPTGEHSADLCDTWGYDYDGVYTMWMVDGVVAYREAVRKVLGNLQGRNLRAFWGEKSADGYADSIEGAINLMNREPMPGVGEWVDTLIRQMWAIQKGDGIIEGWHGDGNFARTSLMYGLWKTQGVTVEPWREDVRWGTVREGAAVRLLVTAERAWEGRLKFDRPRHRLIWGLPLDYPRINQFPEWFTVEPGFRYEVRLAGAGVEEGTGGELAEGWPVRVGPGEYRTMEVRRR